MNPPRPVAVLVAEGISFDQLTMRMTAFNILEAVFAAKIPSLLNKLAVACIYELGAEPAAFFERVELVAPDGSVIWGNVVHVAWEGRSPGVVPNSHRTVHGIWNVIVRSLGDYTIRASHGETADGPWQIVAQRSMVIVEMAHPVFGAAAEPPKA